MIVLKPGFDLDRFFERVQQAPQKVLFLDYDGTLAPFCIDRRRALPYSGVQPVLGRLMRADNTRVVIVSGRSIEDLAALLGLDPRPELWGSHGLEHLDANGCYRAKPVPDRAVAGLEQAGAFTVEQGLGAQCEFKPGCLAIHWRGLGSAAKCLLRERLLPELSQIATRHRLAVHEFDGGIELRSPGFDKGDAVRTVLARMGPDTVAAYLGDDLTDEDGFAAVRPNGIGVLVRGHYRPTTADLWIKPPATLLAFFDRWQQRRNLSDDYGHGNAIQPLGS